MDGKTSVKYIQSYIKRKDYNPELKKWTIVNKVDK